MSAEIPPMSKSCNSPTNSLDKINKLEVSSPRSKTPTLVPTLFQPSRSISSPLSPKQQQFATTPPAPSPAPSESTPVNFSHSNVLMTNTTTTAELKESPHSHTIATRDTKDSLHADGGKVGEGDSNDDDDGDVNGVNDGSGGIHIHGRQQHPQQEFCLRWNNYQTNLTSVFEHLLQNEFFVDVTLACEDQSIKAHKMVLSACSPYFQELFVDNPCHHPIVIMRDIKWTEMKSIVDFMYKGEINVSQEQIGPLLRIAETLKIRGLADVSSERPDISGGLSKSGSGNSDVESGSVRESISRNRKHVTVRNEEPEVAVKKSRISLSRDWDVDINIAPPTNIIRNNSNSLKRNRWPSGDSTITRTDSPTIGCDTPSSSISGHNMNICAHNTPPNIRVDIPSPVLPMLPISSTTPGLQQHSLPHHHQQLQHHHQTQQQQQQQQQHQQQQQQQQQHTPTSSSLPSSFSMGPTMPSIGIPPSMAMSHADDAEIRPGIAEMIREEERAKLMENSQSWMAQSNSSIADSYQYQLQSWWQKCWSTNHNLMTNLRFRERGPLKSWRPETMAEAIISVLKESLSLSQAAKKYDIPYPTFVLYANRVHNMLGPSMDGGTDLRPKGRGRPQRILLGIWPDEHIRSVIKTIVFRDVKELKEEGMPLQYGPNSPGFPFQDSGGLNYPGIPCPNGLQPNHPSTPLGDPMSPEATAAAVAAVAHGIRQQMQMAAAAQHHPDANPSVFNLSSHLQGHPSGIELSNQNPASLFSSQSGQAHTSPSLSSMGLPSATTLDLSGISNSNILHGLGGINNNNIRSSQSSSRDSGGGLFIGPCTQETLSNTYASQRSLCNLSSTNQPPSIESAHDLRMNSPDTSPFHSSVDILQPAVNLAVGVSGMPYKTSSSSRGGFSSPHHPDHLFQDDITDLVGGSNTTSFRKRPININNFKDPSTHMEIEPITSDCRSD